VRWLRSRYFLLSVLLPLFLLAFLRTEMQWRECEQDREPVCFSYPSYLQHETWQGLDLHWLAFIPGAIADALPDSITPFPDRSRRRLALRYLIAFGSVAALWWVVGIWWERLHSGHRLKPEQRRLRRRILLLTGLFTPLVALMIYNGISGGYHGPF